MESWQEANERRTGRRPATPQLDSSVRAARAARAMLEGALRACCLSLVVSLLLSLDPWGAGLLPFASFPALHYSAGWPGCWGVYRAQRDGSNTAFPAGAMLPCLPPSIHIMFHLAPRTQSTQPIQAGEHEPLVDPEAAAWTGAGGLAGQGGMRRNASMFFPASIADADYADKFGHYK